MPWKAFTSLLRNDSSSMSSDESSEIIVNRHHKRGSSNSKQPESVTIECPQTATTTASTRRVTFSTIQVRHYNRIVGDHPGCEFPLSLGWSFRESAQESVHAFDQHHHETNPDYLTAKYILPVTEQERKQLLRHAGYSKSRMRQEERKRRIHILVEWFHHGNPTEEWYTYSFPENSKLLVQRYVCERPCGVRDCTSVTTTVMYNKNDDNNDNDKPDNKPESPPPSPKPVEGK